MFQKFEESIGAVVDEAEVKRVAAIKNWISELRSGKRGQTAGRLRRGENEFCVLGVLYDTLPPECGQWVHSRVVAGGVYTWKSVKPDSGFTLAEKVIGHDNVTRLYQMNDGTFDGRRYSFAELADWMEENLL